MTETNNNINTNNNTIKPLKIGLTGSIGMGKSTISKHLKDLGFAVFDADKTVHELYSYNGLAVKPISKILPDVIINGEINRKLLSEKILTNQITIKEIEDIVHPLVSHQRQQFYYNKSLDHHFLVIYDIPLLYENYHHYNDLDYVIVASADKEIQKQRVLSRNDMTIDKFNIIINKQISDEEKRNRADYIIYTDYSLQGFSETKHQICRVIESIITKHPNEWNHWKNRNIITTKSLDSKLVNDFDMIVFDLDDTLVPTIDPLKAASIAFIDYIKVNMPNTFKDIDKMRNLMRSLSIERPMISHDFTEMRKAALDMISKPHNEHDKINEAVQIYVDKRSQVWEYLYDDVIPCFEWLKSNDIKISIITNGNANLTLDPIVSKYITISINGADCGAAKPSPVPFMSISQLTNIPSSRILYIGDSFENDVKGSINAGMTAGFIYRSIDIEANKTIHIEPGEVYHIENQLNYSNYINLKSILPGDIEAAYSNFTKQFKL